MSTSITSSSTANDERSMPPASSETALPPQSTFKIVRVKKPDGTIVRMKVPITAGNAVTGTTTPTVAGASTPKATSVPNIESSVTIQAVKSSEQSAPITTGEVSDHKDNQVAAIPTNSPQNIHSSASVPSTSAAAMQEPIPRPTKHLAESAKATPTQSATAIPSEAAASEFMRVRKPDGTIVRVRRPVKTAPSTPGAAATENTPTVIATLQPKLLAACDVAEASRLPNSLSPITVSTSSPLKSAAAFSTAGARPAVGPSRATPRATSNGAKQAKIVGRLYTALRTAVSLYPSDLVSRSDFDQNHEHGPEHDHGNDHSDYDHGSDYGSDNDQESNNGDGNQDHGSNNEQLQNETDAAKAASKIIASHAKTKVITANASVYKPGAEPEEIGPRAPISRPSGTATKPKENLPQNAGLAVDFDVMAAALSAPPPASSGISRPSATMTKPIVDIKEKEMFADEPNNKAVEQDPEKPMGKSPRTLGRRTTRLAQGVAWTIALSFPIFFMILGILNAVLQDKPLSKFGTRIGEINKIAVSVWPILFGAVIAQSLKIYAAWKVERGIKLITLEQLSASSSLATAIKQPFFLQTINWTSITLIVLWGLSPLAGQSFVRMLFQKNLATPESIGLSYVPTHANSPLLTDAYHLGSGGLTVPEISGVFAASLLYYINHPQSPKDQWNNVLIPKMNSTNMEATDAADSSYVAMVGVSISSTPENATTSIEVPQSYFTLDNCRYNPNTSISAINRSTIWPEQTFDPYNPLTAFALETDHQGETFMAILPPIHPDPEIGGLLYFGMTLAPDQYDMADNADARNEADVAFMNCTYSSQHVILNLTCHGPAECEVNSVRANMDTTLSPSYPNMTVALVNELVNALGDPRAYSLSSMLTRFIVDPFTMFDTNNGPSNFTNLTPAIIQTRLELALNTFWLASYEPDLLVENPWTETYDLYYFTENITVTALHSYPVYAIHWGWLTLLLVCSLLLLLFGIIGIILESRTIGPDILGFASSITRDNRYMKIAQDSSLQGGAERTRALRNHMVMLQDVRPDKEVGRIALGTVVDAETNKLKPGRLYR